VRLALSLLLLTAACSPQVTTSERTAAMLAIPGYLRACLPTPSAIPPPKKPRTFEADIAWGNATDARRAATAAALDDCRSKLNRLVALLEGLS